MWSVWYFLTATSYARYGVEKSVVESRVNQSEKHRFSLSSCDCTTVCANPFLGHLRPINLIFIYAHVVRTLVRAACCNSADALRSRDLTYRLSLAGAECYVAHTRAFALHIVASRGLSDL